MSDNQKPTYHKTPHYSLTPPPKGMLRLGTIIDDLDHCEAVNEYCRHDPPPEKVYNHNVEGFKLTRSEMRRGDMGLWAKFLAIDGLSGEADLANERTLDDTYTFDGLDTMTFTPKLDYIKESMAEDDVQEYIKGSGFKPVFIITGLKIARGPAVRLVRGGKLAIKNELAVSLPAGAPIDAGSKADYKRESTQSMSIQKSDDFIFGIRVKKVTYKAHWFIWNKPRLDEPNLVVEHYDTGAKLLDDEQTLDEKQDDGVLEVTLDKGDMAGKTEVQDGDETWIVPCNWEV